MTIKNNTKAVQLLDELLKDHKSPEDRFPDLRRIGEERDNALPVPAPDGRDCRVRGSFIRRWRRDLEFAVRDRLGLNKITPKCSVRFS